MSFENVVVNDRTTQLRVMWQGECWKNKDLFLDRNQGQGVMQKQLAWVQEKLELLVDSGSFVGLDFPLAIMEAKNLEECMRVLENTVIVSPDTKGYEHLVYPVYAKDHSFSVNFVCAWALIKFPLARIETDSFLQYLKEQKFHITDNNFEVVTSMNHPSESYDVVLAEALSGYFYKYVKEDFCSDFPEVKKFVDYLGYSVVPNQMFMVVPEYKDYLEKVKTVINMEEV